MKFQRILRDTSLFVRTRLDADGGGRHIVTSRRGPALCGFQPAGENCASRHWSAASLCPRCVQRYATQQYGSLRDAWKEPE